MQLGREPPLAAAKSLSRPDLLGRGPIAPGTGGVLMRTNDGGVHKVDVPVNLAALLRFGLQLRQDALPDPGLAPAVEPARYRAYRAVAPGQVTPRRTGALDPQNTIENRPVGLVRPPRPGLFRRQPRRHPLPLLVRQVASFHTTEMGNWNRNVSRLQTRPSRTAPGEPDLRSHQTQQTDQQTCPQTADEWRS